MSVLSRWHPRLPLLLLYAGRFMNKLITFSEFQCFIALLTLCGYNIDFAEYNLLFFSLNYVLFVIINNNIVVSSYFKQLNELLLIVIFSDKVNAEY